MYYMDKNTELTTELVSEFIRDFQVTKLPQLRKYKDYYDGNQEILNKTVSDKSKPNNKLVCNYCSDITENYNGYLTGIPISYNSSDDITEILQVLNYNDVHQKDNELLKQALIYGIAYELNYLNEEAMQKFKVLNSEECIPVYSNDLEEELLAVIRVYSAADIKNKRKRKLDLITSTSIKHYDTDVSYSTLKLVDEVPHYYHQVPVTVFKLNSDCHSIFHKVISLQDAYNKLVSASVDDYEAFVDAYMVLKGMTADSEDIALMKENRVLLLDDEDTAEYLTKTTDTSAIENLLQRINDQILKIAKSPDFNDEKFLAQSGIAIKFKMCGMENNASNIEANMRKALQHRLELIAAIQSLTLDEIVWRDIQIVFTRNLPINMLETADLVNKLRGLVSDRTLLSQIPFVLDTDKELELVKEQFENSPTLFNFNGDGDNELLD